MKLKFNIGGKLWLGYGLLLGSILISSVVTYFTLVKTSKLNTEIHEVSNPSLMHLKELRSLLGQSEKLISVWVSNNNDDIPQKSQLSKMHSEDFPIVLKSLKQISKTWVHSDKLLIDSILVGVDSLLRNQHNIMLKYDEKEAYDTEEAALELPVFRVSFNTGEKFEQMTALLYDIEKVIYSQEKKSLFQREEIQRLFTQLQNFAFYLGLLFFVLGLLVAFFIINSIVDPIHKLRDLLQTMGQGVLPLVQLEDRKDEIGQINRALINLISGLKSIVSFSKSIGNGDFEVNFKPLSSNDDLGNNLLLMKNNLKKVAEDDNKRNWTTGGLAKFSELLRVSSDNVLKLTDNLVTELVHYLDANQGSIFVINDSDPNIQHLEMKACFAWERQKFIDQKIYIGEGLVGQSWQERDTIYITDVPDNYIKITSGLGRALPKSILIVPMVANDVVFGVMEIASFRLFEKYEIDFVEHLAASTATTISSARVNERTKKLLEQAQYSSEQLKIHEEEVRKQQAEINKKQEYQEIEIGLLKKQVTELTFKNTHLKDENEVLQNLILKFKKEIDSE